MTYVTCEHTDCVHCNTKDFHCEKECVLFSEEYDEGCSEYESYLDGDDYSEKYFICVRTKDGKSAKAVKPRGKRIEYKGRVFFTSERVSDDEGYGITDAETGLHVGTFALLEDRFDRILERAEKYPKVESLPLAEWCNGGYVIVEEKSDAN